jgi:hypothetical protein
MKTTPFENDLQKPFQINSTTTTMAHYNLIISIRDMRLWQTGMKPNRHWKVTDVKAYFGIKGEKRSILMQLLEMKSRLATIEQAYADHLKKLTLEEKTIF